MSELAPAVGGSEVASLPPGIDRQITRLNVRVVAPSLAARIDGHVAVSRRVRRSEFSNRLP